MNAVPFWVAVGESLGPTIPKEKLNLSILSIRFSEYLTEGILGA